MARQKEVRQRGKKKRGGRSDEQKKRPSHKAAKSDGHPDAVLLDNEPAFVEDRIGDQPAAELASTTPAAETTPSWMLSANQPLDTSAPFGLVDPDLKGYLRSAHVKLQENASLAIEEQRTVHEDDDVRALRNAMLEEIKGKELTLATDTDTSAILEDMLVTFGERQVRTLTEALCQDTFTVVRHRFGSHVLQALLAALQYHVSHDRRADESSSSSVVRTSEQLVLDISSVLHQRMQDFARDPFASHVLRTLLLVLAGQIASVDNVRSKRSRHFHKNLKAFGAQAPWSGGAVYDVRTPESFHTALRETLKAFRAAFLDPAHVRVLCVDPIASPTFSLVLDLDAEQRRLHGKEGDEGLLDACLDGLVKCGAPPTERSSHVETLLRDAVGSHLLECAIKVLDDATLERFWVAYIKGRVAKLGSHPTANFVVSGVARRLPTQALFEDACTEVEEHGSMLVSNGHLGVLTALITRAEQFIPDETEPVTTEAVRKPKKKTVWTSDDPASRAVRAVLHAYEITSREVLQAEEQEGAEDAGGGALVRLLLSGKTVTQRKKDAKLKKKAEKEAKRKRKNAENDEQREAGNAATQPTSFITLHGSLLCQAIARLSEPAVQPLLDSIVGMTDVRPIASDASGVHVLLAALHSPRLSFTYRSRLCGSALARLTDLLSDKFGSRFVDGVYDVADLFFKQKVARACINEERVLLASQYGRFFLKRVHLALFRRDLEAWKRHTRDVQQKQRADAEMAAVAAAAASEKASEARKVAAAEQESLPRKKQKRSKEDEAFAAILAQV